MNDLNERLKNMVILTKEIHNSSDIFKNDKDDISDLLEEAAREIRLMEGIIAELRIDVKELKRRIEINRRL